MTLKSFLEGKRICIIGAHPDDIELGMGGTLNQIKDLDPRIYIGSSAETIKGNKNIVIELGYSMGVYELSHARCGWITRTFYLNQGVIRDKIFELYDRFDVFFTHSKHSQHIDHRILGEVVEDIVKDKTVISWEEVHSGKNIPINMWNEIRPVDLMTKMRALECYESQSHRPYFEGDVIPTLARYRGNQILKTYAEAFNIVRLVT